VNRSDARVTARYLLKIIPLVMRTVAAELRAAGELPAPAHFGLLSLLSAQPRTLTELASLQGVSLPTMSNSISAMVDRGWVRRLARGADRRVVVVEVTGEGKAALRRVGRAAEGHLAEWLAPLDAGADRRLRLGLDVLEKAFEDQRASTPERARRRTRPTRTSA
jgi:DNA-binding MarR family transcriptional regulator